MSTLKVWFDHQTIAEHPAGSTRVLTEVGDLVVTEPDGRTKTYRAGEWHGDGFHDGCAFVEPRADCPRCHREG